MFKISYKQFFHGIGSTDLQSEAMNFLLDWRALSDNEKEAIQKVIEAFKAIR